jgi:hypothetical protein
MNTNIRYLILDSKNVPQRPKDHGVSLPNLQSDASPSFTSRETAETFGTLLAAANLGERFYLAMVLAGVVGYTKVAPGAADTVAWTEATAT